MARRRRVGQVDPGGTESEACGEGHGNFLSVPGDLGVGPLELEYELCQGKAQVASCAVFFTLAFLPFLYPQSVDLPVTCKHDMLRLDGLVESALWWVKKRKVRL